MSFKDLGSLQFVEQLPRFALELDETMEFVSHLLSETFLVDKFFLDFLPWLLIKLIDT